MAATARVGIERGALYLPRFRLERAKIASSWGGKRAPGARAVASFDEDALTMGVEAALGCLEAAGSARARCGALYFASTSSPYAEKQVASVLATACDLPRQLAVADLGGSVRSGLGALRLALDAVRAGAAQSALVVAADCRLAPPGSPWEGTFGDGAAGLFVGSDEVIAEHLASASVAEEFTFQWRTDTQRTVQAADARFSTSYGYLRDAHEAVGTALERAQVRPDEVRRAVLGAPEPRAARELARKLGLAAENIEDSLFTEAGTLGAADPLAGLVTALSAASPGDVLVVVGFGEGAEAMVFRVTEALACWRPEPRRGLPEPVTLPTYERYLVYRGLLPAQWEGEPVTSVLEWKELKQDIRLYGSRCLECGLVQYPQAQVCIGCNARERMVDHKLARRGEVFTYTLDNLATAPEHPLGMVVVDLEGGGRLYLQATDVRPEEVKVGMRVQLTFRRLHEAAGNRNYFWKARPAGNIRGDGR